MGSNLYSQKSENHVEPWDEVLNFMVSKVKEVGDLQVQAFMNIQKMKKISMARIA